MEEIADQSPQRGTPSPGPAANAAPTGLGVRLIPITTSLAQRFRLGADAKGALIIGIESGSSAARAGLQPGDLIERVGQTAISTPEQVQTEVRRALDRQAGKAPIIAALYINRGGERRFVFVSLGK